MFGCLLSWVSFKRLFIDSRGKKRYPSNEVSKMAKIGVHTKNPRITFILKYYEDMLLSAEGWKTLKIPSSFG
jgi:hypothetical protein